MRKSAPKYFFQGSNCVTWASAVGPPTRWMCPRCGTGYDEGLASLDGKPVCVRCLFAVARQSAGELETERLAELETVAGAAPSATPEDWPEFPNYEILGVIGRGGMGVVYKARQKGLDRTVALKVLREGAADEEGLRRFLNEARAAARLQHPHIVSIHEVSDRGGRPFFSMDYVEGRTLGDWFKDPARAPREVADALRKAALAVHHAHESGVVHRDLKPGNILVDRNGDPKVTDFGIAKDITADAAITREGAAIGTPWYMAPEQALGANAEVGPRSDVYALGAILYEALARRPPFASDSPTQSLRQAVLAEPAPPRRINPAASPELEAICLRALQKEPARRYPSAAAFAEDLARFLRDQPVAARHPRPWAAIAAGVAALLAVVLFLAGRRPAPEASLAERLGARLRAEPDERKRTAAALLELGAEGIPVWRRLLSDADPEVRWRAAEALGDLKVHDAVPDLVRALEDPDVDVGRRALEALADLEALEAVRDVVELLRHPRAGVRGRAGRLLEKLKARAAAPLLSGLLKDEEPRVRESAAATLGRIGARDAVADLVGLLDDEHTDVRQAAISALVALDARETAPRLGQLLKDENAAIRESAASSLGKLGARAAIPELVRLRREDPSSGVQSAADQALESLGVPEAERK